MFVTLKNNRGHRIFCSKTMVVRGDRESKGNHLKFSKEVRRRQKSCVEGVV